MMLSGLPKSAVVQKIEAVFSAQNDQGGTPEWQLAVTPPANAPRASSGNGAPVRNLGCSDLEDLSPNALSKVCSSEFGYVPDYRGQHLSQPGNAPLGVAKIGDQTVAFMLGSFACPRQCGDLEYTQAFSDTLVSIDPSSQTPYSLLIDGEWKPFESSAALYGSPEYTRLLQGYSGSLEEGLWRKLENMRDTRADVAALPDNVQNQMGSELWEAASVRDLPDLGAELARATARAAAATQKQTVTCASSNKKLPRSWADAEKIVNVPSTGTPAGVAPTTCTVTTVAESPGGSTVVSETVPAQDVQAALRQQLEEVRAANMAELAKALEALEPLKPLEAETALEAARTSNISELVAALHPSSALEKARASNLSELAAALQTHGTER
jgi:hypothetical protein